MRPRLLGLVLTLVAVLLLGAHPGSALARLTPRQRLEHLTGSTGPMPAARQDTGAANVPVDELA